MGAWSYEFDVIDDCSDLDSWTRLNEDVGEREFEQVADNVINGAASIRAWSTTVPVGGMQIRKNISHSFSQDDRLGLVMYCPYVPSADIGAVLGGDSLAAFGGGNRYRVGLDADYYTRSRVGWQLVPISFGDIEVELGSPTIAMTYASMQLSLIASAAEARDVTFDSIVRYRSRPAVLFTTDGGFIDIYRHWAPYANAHGISMMFHVTPEWMGQTIGSHTYASVAQCLELIEDGNIIGADGSGNVASGTDFGTMPNRIVETVNDLEQIFGFKIKYHSYPQGAYASDNPTQVAKVFEACEQAGLVTARTTRAGYLFPGAYSPYTLPRTDGLESTTTLADAKAQVDYAIKHGLTALFAGHSLRTAADALTWAIDDWHALIEYVVDKRDQGLIDTPRYDEYFSGVPRAAV